MPRDMQLLANDECNDHDPVHVAIVGPDGDIDLRDQLPFRNAVTKLIDLFQCHDEPEFAVCSVERLHSDAVFALMDDTKEYPEGEIPDGALPEGVVATLKRRK